MNFPRGRKVNKCMRSLPLLWKRLPVICCAGMGMGLPVADVVSAIGTGIWSGGLFILTGLLGVCATGQSPVQQQPHPPRIKQLFTAFMALSIVSAGWPHSCSASISSPCWSCSLSRPATCGTIRPMTSTITFFGTSRRFTWVFGLPAQSYYFVRLFSLSPPLHWAAGKSADAGAVVRNRNNRKSFLSITLINLASYILK